MILKRIFLVLLVMLVLFSGVSAFRIMKISPETYASLSNAQIQNYIIVNTHTTGYTITQTNLEYSISVPSVSWEFDNSELLTIWLVNESHKVRLPLSTVRACLNNYNMSVCQQYLLYANYNYTIKLDDITYYVEPATYQIVKMMQTEYDTAIYLRNFTQNWLSEYQTRQLINQFANVSI